MYVCDSLALLSLIKFLEVIKELLLMIHYDQCIKVYINAKANFYNNTQMSSNVLC